MAKKKGLGDLIAAVTEAGGIEPCEGCDKRKETLNKIKIFQFGTEELTEDEKKYLCAFFATEQNDQQPNELLTIYFRVYRVTPFDPCDGCSGVWKSIIKKLKKLDYK